MHGQWGVELTLSSGCGGGDWWCRRSWEADKKHHKTSVLTGSQKATESTTREINEIQGV